MAKIVIEIEETSTVAQAQGKVLGGSDPYTKLQKLMNYLKSKLAGAGSDIVLDVSVVDDSSPLLATAISAANPTALTVTAHGLTSGDLVQISGSNSTPSINGLHKVTVTGPNAFTIPVNVSGAGTAASILKVETTVAGEVVASETSSI